MKRKLERFDIIANRDNVVQPGKDIYPLIRGKWNEQFFKNQKSLTVELACGRGEYTIGLAAMFPERNFIGVDIKGDRLWKGSTLALEGGLTNAGFLRAHILMMENFFDPGEINEIWLTFPDPRPRKKDIKRRLTSSRYLNIYKTILNRDGWFHFKTDNTALFEYSLDELCARGDVRDLILTDDLYNSNLRADCYDIKTRYEEIFTGRGETIKYLRFRFQEIDSGQRIPLRASDNHVRIIVS